MPSPERGPRFSPAAVLLLSALFVVQSAYLFVDAAPTLFYVANSFAHVLLGAFLALPLLAIGRFAAARARSAAASAAAALGWLALILLGLSVVAGLALVVLENTRGTRGLLFAHAGLGAGAVVAAVIALLAARRRLAGADRPAALGILTVVASVLVVAVIPAWRAGRSPDDHIVNPARPPASMGEEAMAGAEGPFFPSSAATSTGGRIPSDFFMTSDVCARCHQDIYEQWQSSAHHFSSFNNQWYRASIEYMQQVTSTEASKWCAGCHDHAVLFNGMMDDPVEAFVGTPEAHTGLGCNSCHAITRVKDTMGQGGFHIEYPPLHDLAASPNPVLRWLHDTAIRLDPGPHREVFLRPFHREQTGEFCSSCHKVHLDEPVNSYRWLRGFNEYDNWQASGVSGQGARSFYYPAAPLDCADCHMPRIPSEDSGNIDGFVHDHSFLAANTALPVANLHEDQLRRTIEFLQRNQVTVDILAAGPARPLAVAGAEGGPRLASTFAVGEESAMQVGTGGRGGGATQREPAPIWGPLDSVPVSVRRGEDSRIDVVVRTRGVGHFFPGGTVDAHEVWLELHARDETGRTIFWSGVAHDGGKGIVDPGAQFYRAKMIDGHGNPIDRRNAVHTRAVAWVNLIPPGAADVAHYRLSVPADCGDEITLEARLNYRKFTHANTRFAFAGRPADGEPERWGPGVERVTPHWDDREFVHDVVPADVSAELREVPVLPIVVMDRREARLRVVGAGTDPANPVPDPSPEHTLRWNDYGIGLLRQGDLQGAQRAFELVVTCDPDYADGHVNLGRVALREGLLDDAMEAMGRTLELDPDLAKAHYFTGVVLKERGRYDEALASFRIASARYPRDRVVLNDIGRVLFLQRRFEEAVEALQSVLAVDPEDLMAHYNLMLCFKGLGRLEDAEAERQLYERFKADEDSNILLGPYLRANPEDNRMRQPIREQVSAPREVIERELALRAVQGEPYTVLPGQAAEYSRRTVEDGRARQADGHGSDRHAGPAAAGEMRGTD